MDKTIKELKHAKKVIESEITRVLKDFEKEFGVKVEYTNYDNGTRFWDCGEKKSGPKKFKFDIDIN